MVAKEIFKQYDKHAQKRGTHAHHKQRQRALIVLHGRLFGLVDAQYSKDDHDETHGAGDHAQADGDVIERAVVKWPHHPGASQVQDQRQQQRACCDHRLAIGLNLIVHGAGLLAFLRRRKLAQNLLDGCFQFALLRGFVRHRGGPLADPNQFLF